MKRRLLTETDDLKKHIMEIKIDDNIVLRKVSKDDIVNLAKYLNNIGIYKNTLNIPFPYSKSDAEFWINLTSAFESENKIQKHWIIRHETDGAIGGIGLQYNDGIDSHKNEIGYWLAQPFWGEGIMTKVVGTFVNYCFDSLQYKRIQAPIFSFNKGSEKVLIKNDFLFEGEMKNYDIKDGNLINVKMFAKTV